MWSVLTDLALPRRCAGCGRPGELLCPDCRPTGPPLRLAGFAGVVLAAGRYERRLRSAVLAYKERGRRELARPLAQLLALAPLLALGRPVVLVPVPSARAAARRRGGDHVLRMARVASAQSRVPIAAVLQLVRTVHDSAGLGAVARQANLAGAMAAARPPPALTSGRLPAAVLVDDIVTTGATLHEATRALRSAGWPVLGGVALAATPRRRTEREQVAP